MSSRLKTWSKREIASESRRAPSAQLPPIPRPINKQLQSALLGKLPIELRILIYTQILHDFGGVQHISLCLTVSKEIKHSKCLGERAAFLSRDLQRYWGPWGCNHSWCQQISTTGVPSYLRTFPLLSLLQACRAIYSEFIGMVYRSIAFNIVGLEATKLFLGKTLDSGLSNIQVLQFSWVIDSPCYLTDAQLRRYGNRVNTRRTEADWEGVWGVISRMSSLKELKVTIYGYDFQVSEPKLLAPLFAIQVETFVVDLLWPTRFDTIAANAPFRIMPLTDGDEATIPLPSYLYMPRRNWLWRFCCFPFNR